MRLALIAHDEKKPDIIEFARSRLDDLERFDLMATGTTGKRLREATGLDIERKQSGPIGGDMQIGAEIADGNCDGVIFLRDPLTAQPHEPDISALLRLCDVHSIPLATNLASADAVLDELVRVLDGDERSGDRGIAGSAGPPEDGGIVGGDDHSESQQ